jgi:hypothetical protein
MKKKPARWTSAAARRIVAAAGGEQTVERAVVEVVDRLRAGTEGPPTDLRAICGRLGVKSCRPESLPVAGELRRDGTGLMIAYSPGLQAGRRRFTIAHELGHAFFEHTGRNCPRRGEELERICDLFAVELLMPAGLAKNTIEGNDPSCVFAIANRFDVSMSAAMYRFTELSGIHSALDMGDFRGATLAVLKVADPWIDEMVGEAREGGVASDVIRLGRNRVWNGAWRVQAARADSGYVVALTAEPVERDGRPVLSTFDRFAGSPRTWRTGDA